MLRDRTAVPTKVNIPYVPANLLTFKVAYREVRHDIMDTCLGTHVRHRRHSSAYGVAVQITAGAHENMAADMYSKPGSRMEDSDTVLISSLVPRGRARLGRRLVLVQEINFVARLSTSVLQCFSQPGLSRRQSRLTSTRNRRVLSPTG